MLLSTKNYWRIFIKKIKASLCAKLILINMVRYSEEKGKEVSRSRISRETLRRISGRKHLKDAFISELDDELRECGWYIVQHLDSEFFILDSSKVDNWTKIGSSRIRKFLDMDDDEYFKTAVEEEYIKCYGSSEDDFVDE